MNKAILVGRLTRDPETRHLGGHEVANFTVAVDRRFKNSKGERETDFINCTAWRKTAEVVTQYFQKGNKIGVVGTIQTRSWEDKDGSRRFATEVVVDEVHFIESKSSQNQDTHGSYSYGHKEKGGDTNSVKRDSEQGYDTPLPFDL